MSTSCDLDNRSSPKNARGRGNEGTSIGNVANNLEIVRLESLSGVVEASAL